MIEELLRSTSVPDTGSKLRFVREFDGFGTRFFRIRVERILYLVYDRYVRDRGSLRAIPTLAFLVFKTLEDSVSFAHLLEVAGKRGISEKQALEKTFRRASYESLVARDVFFRVLGDTGDGADDDLVR